MARIQQISDSSTCYQVFKNLIYESKQQAPSLAWEQSLFALHEFDLSLAACELANGTFAPMTWELYPRFVKAYALLHGFTLSLNQQFAQCGFLQDTIAETLNETFLKAFAHARSIPFLQEDHAPNYLSTPLTEKTESELNATNTYYAFEEEQIEALNEILKSLQNPIAEAIGMPWRVLTVRMWETSVHSRTIDEIPSEEIFPPKNPTCFFHVDGFPLNALKILLYPRGVNLEKGTTELQLSNGLYLIEGGPGTWILFKNSEITHRAIPPKTNPRLIVEITIAPSIIYDCQAVCAGLNARYPPCPWQYPPSHSQTIYTQASLEGLNIGGGPNWMHSNWLNLEEVRSDSNPHSFHLYPNCKFPLPNQSVSIVYSSHSLEHLNIPTVYRVLSEAHRTLRNDGNLVIKIPDFDQALSAWRSNDPAFFGPGWNIESVTPLWGNHGVCDCLDHRAAMLFCSFFNTAYGNPFGCVPNNDTAPIEAPYFGPPIDTIANLRDLIAHDTPFQIAQNLRKIVRAKQIHYQWCHQSAWSRNELKTLLHDFGFEVLSFDPSEIINRFHTIPGIDSMKEKSTFCWAKRVSRQ